MSSFLSRILIFLTLLLAGQVFGWEFMLAGVIFLSATDRDYFEVILLGLIFDLTLAFPSFFFTSTILAILISSILGQEIFKSENIFNRAVKALFLGLVACVAMLIFFWSEFSVVSLIKFLLPVFTILLLKQIKFAKYGQKAFLQ